MPDSSAELVRVYTQAVERGEPPRISVARYFAISVTAAAGRIYRARKKGLLAPFQRRRYVVDAGELRGVVVPAAGTQVERRVAYMEPEERQKLRKAFDEGKGCPQCGGLHTRACPRVKRIVYRPDGSTAEVEFWRDGEWPTDSIIWPEDIEDVDDE